MHCMISLSSVLESRAQSGGRQPWETAYLMERRTTPGCLLITYKLSNHGQIHIVFINPHSLLICNSLISHSHLTHSNLMYTSLTPHTSPLLTLYSLLTHSSLISYPILTPNTQSLPTPHSSLTSPQSSHVYTPPHTLVDISLFTLTSVGQDCLRTACYTHTYNTPFGLYSLLVRVCRPLLPSNYMLRQSKV